MPARGVVTTCCHLTVILVALLPEIAAQTVTRFINPSGLIIIVAERHTTPVVTVEALVRSGPIYEDHLLGTGVSALAQRIQVHHPPPDVLAMTRRTGSQFEFRTTVSYCSYRLQTTTAHVDDAIRAVALLLRHTEVNDASMARERERLLLDQEQALSDPERLADMLVAGSVYQQHPARLPVLGRRDALLALQLEDVQRYLQRRYTAPNVVLTVVGNVDANAIRRVVRRAFAYFPEGSYDRAVVPEEPPQYDVRHRAESAHVPRPLLRLAFRTVPLQHPDQTALAALASILHASDSPLRLALEGEQLVTGLQVRNHATIGRPGYFEIRYGVRPEQANLALSVLNESLASLRGSDLDWSAMLTAARKRLAHAHLARDGADIAADLCRWELAMSQPDWGNDLPERLAGLQPADLQRIAATYLQRDRLNRVVLRPDSDQRAEASSATVPPALSTVPPQRHTFDNGVRLVLQNIDTGIAAVVVSIGGGPAVEAAHQRGATAMLARLLQNGLEQATSREPELADMQVDTVVTSDALHLWLTCFADKVPAALAALSGQLHLPQLDPDRVSVLRQQAMERLSSDPMYQSWQERIGERLRQIILGEHWAARNPLGTRESITNLDHEVLRQFLDEILVGDNITVSVVGGPSPLQPLLEQMSEGLGDSVLFPSGATRLPPPAPGPADRATVVELKGPQPESAMGFGWSLTVAPEQRAALHMLTALLGGASGRDGRLGRALTATADGNVQRSHLHTELLPRRGLLTLLVQVPQAYMEQVRDTVTQELERFTALLTAEQAPEGWASELAAARSACLTQAGMVHEDPNRAGRLYNEALLRSDSLERPFGYDEAIEAVDRQALLALIRQGFDKILAEVRLTQRLSEPETVSEEELEAISTDAASEQEAITEDPDADSDQAAP